MKRVGLLLSILIIITSCKTNTKKDYKFDKIIVAKVHCHIINDDESDYGFGDCPEYAISIDNNLNYLTTRGFKTSSKLECFSGKVSATFWDNLYDNFAEKILTDSINFNLKEYRENLKSGKVYEVSDGPYYYIWLFRKNKNIKTIVLYDLKKYKSLFDNITKLKINTVQIKDTILINLNDFVLMPPPKSHLKQQVLFIKAK